MRARIRGLARRFGTTFRELSAAAPPPKPWRAYGNWLRTNYELWAQPSTVRARPIKLTIDPTNVCQLRCPLCPTGYQVQDRPRGHASLHVFDHLLDELGDYLFFIDFFNWGEPLLSPHLIDMIARARAKRIATSVSSNVSLPLSDEKVERLVTSGLGSIVCSIDGASQATYATYRRGGDFDLAFDNMRRIIATRNRLGLRRPVVCWQFLVFAFNEHERDRATHLAREIGTDRLDFLAPFLDLDRFALSAEDQSLATGWAARDARFNRYDATHREYVDRPGGRRRRCDWHYVSSAVNWDGSVAPCCTVFEKRDDFGVLDYERGATYMSIVNNDRFRSVRDLVAGRVPERTGLVCERCPTPSIMRYAPQLNRRIAMLILAQAANAVRHR